MTGKRIAIVGAGVAGLAAAYDLARGGHQVTIFEAAPDAGWLAAGFKAADWDWSLEKFYHHWFASDKYMLGLIDELGWRDQVIFRRPYTVVFYDGKFQPLDSYVEALKFSLRHFSIPDVIRFGAVAFTYGSRPGGGLWRNRPQMPGCANGFRRASMIPSGDRCWSVSSASRTYPSSTWRGSGPGSRPERPGLAPSRAGFKPS